MNACRILRIPSNVILLPYVVMLSFLDDRQVHIIKITGRIQLGRLDDVHTIFHNVVWDKVSARDASIELHELLTGPAVFTDFQRCILSSIQSAFMCSLSFGGSFVDALAACPGAFLLCWVQLRLLPRNASLASLFE